MHGDALELQRHRAHPFDRRRQHDAAECLDRRTVAPGIGDARVAGDGLDQRGQRQRRPLQQQGLDAAVLVAELDLQVLHPLAMAHEAEVAGLDDAGMDRADTDLVDFLAAHHEERVLVQALLPRALETHRLEPGVTFGQQAGLLPQLTLGHLRRRIAQRERGVAGVPRGTAAQHAQAGRRRLQHGSDEHAAAVRCAGPAEQGHQTLARSQRSVAGRGPVVQARRCEVLQRHAQRRLERPHHCPPIDRATCCSSA